jgi:GntR family transcriptional regulator
VVIRKTKYGIIADALSQRIAAGQYAVGTNIPAESALAVEFGVSRMTVRQALEALETDQLIARIHGRGTVVLDQRYMRSTSGLRGIVEDLTEAGHKIGAAVLEFERVVPDDTVARALELAVGELAIAVVRLRSVDDEEFGIQYTWLPNRWLPGLEAADLENASLYSVIEERYGLRLQESEQSIGARSATDLEAERLGIDRGSAVVAVTRRTTLTTGEPIEYMDASYRPDLVTYVSTLQRAAHGTDQRHQPRMAFTAAD